MRKLLCVLICMLMPCMALAQTPRRVVSLYGSFAEAWTQAGGTLAGVTDDAVSERGLDVDSAMVIGTTKAPNLELVLSLDPDLVILSSDIAAQSGAREVLQNAGVPCRAYRVDTWRDYAAMMDDFTRLTGRRDLYEAIIPPMEKQIESVISAAKKKQGPKTLLLRAYSGGAKVKGADNLAGAMLRDLGCVNVADLHPSLLEDLSLEAIVTEDPDWILVSVMGGDEEAALKGLYESLGKNPAFQALTAVREGRMRVLPRELFHYKPNARWAESYRYLYEMLFEESI